MEFQDLSDTMITSSTVDKLKLVHELDYIQLKKCLFHPVDPNQIITISHDFHSVQLWDIKKKTNVTLQGHTGEVNDISFNPANYQIASCAKDKSVIIWDSQSLQIVNRFSYADEPTAICHSPSGKYLATGLASGHIHVLKGENTSITTQIGSSATSPPWEPVVTSLRFSPDETTLLAGSKTREVFVIDLITSDIVKTIRFGDWIYSMDIKNHLLAVGCWRIGLKVVDRMSERKAYFLDTTINSIHFATNGKLLVVSTDPVSTMILDTQSWEIIWQYHAGSYSQFSPDSNSLAILSFEKIQFFSIDI
jgi:WD40 repeat protein